MRAIRHDVRFVSHGLECGAWLYMPEGVVTPPVVVMAHGFSAERGFRLDAFAEKFAEAGMAALVFDYRNFGDSEGKPRFLADHRRHLEDWRSAIAYARAHPDLDSSRLALWGSSYSGGHVICMAAEDEDVSAIVAQVPYVGGLDLHMPLTIQLRAFAYVIADQVARLFGGAVRVPVVGPPGSFSILNAPEAMEMLDLVPEGSGWCNRVPARALLTLPSYQPREAADGVMCPALIVVGERDETTPPGLARAAAEKMPQAEVVGFDAGHFEVYVPPRFEEVAACEAAFLARHLGVTR